MNSNIIPIPEPPGAPLIGNLAEINSEFPLGSLIRLANLYGTFLHSSAKPQFSLPAGPIYRLNIVGRSSVVISTHALLNEVCDEERFAKIITPVLEASI